MKIPMVNITDFLPHDADHALSVRVLSERTGMDSREATRWIERARRAGEPICSSGKGFWLTDDPNELLSCADDLNRRIRTQRQTEKALRRTARRLLADERTAFTQIRIDDEQATDE